MKKIEEPENIVMWKAMDWHSWFDKHLKGKVVVDESDLVKVYAETLCPGTDWSSSMWDEGTHEAYLIKSSIREIKKDCEHKRVIQDLTTRLVTFRCLDCHEPVSPLGWKEI